jgi:hypothetical protein
MTPTPTPTMTPTQFYCGNGVTTGTYYYYDCCGQVKTGYAAGLLVVMDYSKPSNGITKLNVAASQICPSPTPTGTPNSTPSNTPTSTVTPTLTQTPTVTPSSTPYPPPTPVYTAVNECQVFTVFDMGISCYTVTNPSSSSSFDGILKIEVTGGTAPFTFYWDGGQRSQTLYGIPAGAYPVTVVDYYGDYTASTVCQLVPISPTPSNTPTLTPTPSATPSYDSLCFVAYPTGRLAVVGGGTTYGPWQFVSNGTNNGRPVWTYGTYNIAWSSTTSRWEVVGNDLTTLIQFANGVAVSTSTAVVPLTLWAFNGGATVPPTIFVTEGTCPSNLPLNSTVSVRNTNCSGTQNCSGSITFTANLGVPPYQYSINNGSTYQTSSVFNGLCAGVYQTIVRDASGTTNNRQVTVGSNNASVSYIVSIVSLGSLNNNVSQNESNQLSQFAVQVNPPIPSGTTLTFNLNISYQIQNMGPWTGNDPDATAEFNIVPTLNQNGSSVALVTGATSTSTTNRPGCNPSQMEITSGSFTKQITMTGGSGSVTGTTYVELNVFSPTELNGCVSTMESTITIGVSSAEVSGCYCCSVISNAQPIIYSLTEVGGS